MAVHPATTGPRHEVLGLSLDDVRTMYRQMLLMRVIGEQMIHQFSSPEKRILTGSVCIATQFPHAVGLALAARVRREDHIVFAFGGDAATSPGDFHEALNFASVQKLPV